MRVESYRGWLWPSFAGLWGLALVAMATLSVLAWRLDQAELEARRQAAIDEQVRLALWRIDTALAPLLARESLSVITHLQPVAATERLEILTPDQADDVGGELLPALTRLPIRYRFRWWPDGQHDHHVNHDNPVNQENQVPHEPLPRDSSARPQLDFQAIWDSLRPAASSDIPVSNYFLVDSEKLSGITDWSGNTEVPEQGRRVARGVAQAELHQQARNTFEFNRRVSNIGNMVNQNNAIWLEPVERAGLSTHQVTASPLVAVWSSGELVLANRTNAQGRERLEGSCLDWEPLKSGLLEMISDLLPAARLEPVESAPEELDPNMLVTLPCTLIAGDLLSAQVSWSAGSALSVPRMLIIVWISLFTVALATGVLLAGVLRMSRRRAAFVAAVTHELRTPLTTLQLYSEMLAEGMVQDDDQRTIYMKTMQHEVLRLRHLIENVFAFARLERGRGADDVVTLDVAELLRRLEPRLRKLTKQSPLELVIEPVPLFASEVHVSLSMTEQILSNLIDNACKYAAEASDRRIILTAVEREGAVALRVQDFGPGFDLDSKMGFGAAGYSGPAFSKSVQQAAESAPGIGLGLALSRRLAKQIGGWLRIETTSRGGSVLLKLPTRRLVR